MCVWGGGGGYGMRAIQYDIFFLFCLFEKNFFFFLFFFVGLVKRGVLTPIGEMRR